MFGNMEKLNLLQTKDFNKYDFFIILIIASLAYGGYELLGAFTPIRLIGVFSLCFIVKNWNKLIHSYFARWIKFLCFWWLFMTISILWTPNKILGITYWFHFTCMIACIFLLFLLTSKAKYPLYSFSVGWMMFVIITIPIAVWEINSGSHLTSGSFNFVDGGMRRFAAVTFSNYNSYSLMLTYSLPFLVLLMWKKSKLLFKIIVLIISLTVSVVLLINSSRGAFICLITVVILMLTFRFKYLNSFQHIFFLGILCLYAYFATKNIDSVDVFSQIEARLDGKNSFVDNNRMKLIEKGLEISADYLYLGGGIMSMISLYNQFHADYDYAHNLIIEILVEYGALICILFLYLLIVTFRELYKINDNHFRFLFYYTLISLPFMMVIDDYYFVRSGFWIYLATIISISKIPNIIKNR